VDFAGECHLGRRYAKAETNGGTADGDQGTHRAVWAVAGENDHAALSNEREAADFDFKYPFMRSQRDGHLACDATSSAQADFRYLGLRGVSVRSASLGFTLRHLAIARGGQIFL
jgi:hypothetical protein